MREDIEKYLATEEYISRIEYELWLEGKCRCGMREDRCKCRGWNDGLDFVEVDWL